jgi:hypothetical protein
MSLWDVSETKTSESRKRRQIPLLLSGLGMILLSIGILSPWVSPRRSFNYNTNKIWFIERMQKVDALPEIYQVTEALGCNSPCMLDEQIIASPWAPLDQKFANGKSVRGWEILLGQFQPAIGLKLLVVVCLILLLITLIWVIMGEHGEPEFWAALIGLNSFMGLILSVFQLPKIDTLGYDNNFLLSLIAVLAGSHQGWGLWLIVTGYLALLILSGMILILPEQSDPPEQGRYT